MIIPRVKPARYPRLGNAILPISVAGQIVPTLRKPTCEANLFKQVRLPATPDVLQCNM